MTLPEKLAKEALPCLPQCGRTINSNNGHDWECLYFARPDVEAAIKQAMRECARIGGEACGVGFRIRSLITDDAEK